MSGWSNEVELRDENGTMRAYRFRDGREIPIPKYPKPNADMFVWLANLSLDELEAARQYYHDRWTWDEDSERYRALVALVASEIGSRIHLPSRTPLGSMERSQLERVVLDLANRTTR